MILYCLGASFVLISLHALGTNEDPSKLTSQGF